MAAESVARLITAQNRSRLEVDATNMAADDAAVLVIAIELPNDRDCVADISKQFKNLVIN